MPLPKAPTRPATLLDLNEAVIARARRKTSAEVTDSGAGSNPARQAPQQQLAQQVAQQAAPRRSASSAAPAALPATAAASSTTPRAALLQAGPSREGVQNPEALHPAPSDSGVSARLDSGAPARQARSTNGERRQKPARKTGLQEASASSLPPEQVKIFVLDTNVLMHDPSSLFRFEEHDVFLPIITLEELDNNKKGMSEVARNARQVSRSLDALVGDVADGIEAGIALSKLGNREARGRLLLQTEALETNLPSTLATGKADNQILGVVQALQRLHPSRQVVLVSKDINMRIKARALGLRAEDYHNDQVIDDLELLYAGTLALPADFWDRHGKGMESWQQGGSHWYRLSGPMVSSFMLNQFVYLEGDTPLAAQVKELNGRTAVLQTLRDFGHLKNAVWGITARNREQNFALNLLMNPEIDFVSLLGQAGTGKTLLALAAGLAQTLEHKRYTEIIVTRATVPVGEDIGYLPGTEEEKMQPWMGALEDNLEVLNQGNASGGEWGRAAANDLIRTRIKVKALSFMRGRTFINKFLIIDEAQNLTPKQMKTLITRAGPGTKVVCLGNIAQIDTPYLTEGSSGLSYVVDRFKGWAHAGHVTLQRGERSRLADFATDAL
ncbi:MAG: PhoH family protein [Burkholderiales bacterium]